jgi:tripartite-type tricarboxylate transporter receptor subunit TctC
MTVARFAILVLTSIFISIAGPAGAQQFPTRPVSLVVPNPPGGSIDILARVFAQKLQEMWSVPVIVDNKAGGGTLIGMDYVAKSAPDGHTLCMVVTPMVILPALRDKMPYDTLKDLAPVTMIGSASILIAASPALQANTIPELIALAKKHPGKLTYASPGSGSSMHLAFELLKMDTGIDILHVPFKGGAQAYPEVMSGRIDLQLDPSYSIYRHVKAGKLKAIAVTTLKRDPAMPEVPAISETLPGFNVMSMNGVVAAGGTPRAIVQRLNADFRKLLAHPEIAKRLVEFGIEPVGNSPEEFEAFIRSEIARWSKVAKAANIRLD